MAQARSSWFARLGSPRGIAWAGGLLLAAFVGQAAYEIVRSHELAVQATERELDAQSRVIAEQTTRAVQAIDVVLENLVEQLQGGALAHADDATLHAYLRERGRGLVQSDGLAVFRTDGTLRAVSQVPLERIPRRNYADDSTFRTIRDRTHGELFFDHTLVSPGTRRWVFPIGRRLADAQGGFAGIVGAVGRVDYFQQFYRETYPQASTRVALVHRDGTLLARNPPVEQALGKPLSGLDGLMPRDPAAPVTVRRTPSPVDGIDHFVALRLVPGYPLAVAVSREASAALAPWREQALATGLRTLALGALAAGLLVVVLRQLRRLDDARASLEASEARYALAMTGSDEGHWLWNIPAGQVYVSARLAELFGLEGGAQTLPDQVYFDRIPIHPEDRERVHGNRNRHVAGLSERLDHEFRILRPGSGELRWIHTRAQCFRDAEGRPLRMAGSTVDATDRKRLELQLRQAQKLEAIGTLAGGIAHDFNNILSAILGYGELVQRDAPAGTPLRRHVDAAMSAAQRAKSLVERILAFSRSGLGERVPVHVGTVLAEALDHVASALPPAVALERRIEVGSAAVLGDPTQLHQVLMNLCANAVQAMNGRGRLEVEAQCVTLDAALPVATSTLAPGPHVRLTVRDSGEGMAPGVIERIFDPFFTTKEVGVGTGLGLSLVHGIVTDLGGGIGVQSTPGAGSSFTVWLPSRPWVAAPAAVETPVPQGQGETVLVVDDEASLVRLNEELLAELGYEPVGFESAAAALAALQADPQRFDALLSDEAMPGMTGSELVAEARRLRPGLPVVLMSGFVSPALAQRARELGVAEVLAKPLASREIGRALAAALRPLPETTR